MRMFKETLYLKLLEKRHAGIDELAREIPLPRNTIMSYLGELGGLITIRDGIVSVEEPLELALFLLDKGVSVRKISRYLDWRDFEQLSSRILSAYGYSVITNFRLSKPHRLEVDVIGIDSFSKRALMLDCKHWTHGISKSALMEITTKQYERTVRIMENLSLAGARWSKLLKVKEAIPIIVTLTKPPIRSHSNTLIVSIQELNLLLRNFDYIIDLYGVKPIRRKNQAWTR
jgi:hypothetical protein